jgi:hypothetical protein
MLMAQAGQLRFGLHARLDIDEIGQAMKEAADHRDMPATKLAVALRLRGRGKHRRQRLTVQRAPLTEIGRFMDPPRGLGPADPQPISQHRSQLAAQLRLTGLLGELIDQRVFNGRLLPAKTLEPFQHGQPFRGGQHVERQVQGAFIAGFERVENLDDLLTTTRTHVRIITNRSDNRRKLSTGETTVTQVISGAID